MANSSDVTSFLQAVFPDWPVSAVFACNKGYAWTRFMGLKGLDAARPCYFSIARFPVGTVTNALDKALDVAVLVIDDVGTKVAAPAVHLGLGAPTAIVESSPGNFQYSYRLSKPVPKDDWARFFASVEGLVGTKLECRDAVHLFRVPIGVNGKPGLETFQVRLAGIDTTVVLDVDAIMKLAPVAAAGSGTGGSRPEPRVRDIVGLMDLIPNPDVDYDAWMARAHQVKALALDEGSGWDAFDAWSRKSSKYDEAETRRRWDTVEPSRTSGLEILRDAEAADAGGFARVMGAEAGAVFDDDEVTPDPFVEPPRKPGEERVRTDVAFVRGAEDQILTSMDNAARGIAGLGRRVRYDEFHRRFYVGDERLTDHLAMMLRVEMLSVYEKDFGSQHVWDALMGLGLKNRFNPVVDMLAAAEKAWDGVARLDRLGPDYFHSEDTALARACFRKVMIAAVRRARKPGVKFDQILVCESPEGWNKSSAWSVLAGPENFSDASILGKAGREVQEELADVWIHENSDLSGLTRAEVEHVKAFASRVNDRARPAYGRVLLDQPRQSIEVGTTNASAYLLSTTGNRRFWTFTLSAPVDLAALSRDREMLWGEAAALEAGGETLVLARGLWGLAEAAAEKRRVVDPWEDELGNLRGHMAVTRRGGKDFITRIGVHEVLRNRGLLGVANTSTGRRIADIMRKLGWEDCKYKIDGETVRGFERAPIPGDDAPGGRSDGASATHLPPKNPF